MERSFGLLFFLRKTRIIGSREDDIFVRITVNGNYCEISTKRKCDRSRWNGSSGRVIGKTADAKQLNSYLDTFQQKIYEAKRQLLETNQEVTSEAIKSLVIGVDGKKKHTLMNVFRLHNEQMKELIGKQYAPATYVRFETTIRHTKNFLFWRYQVLDIDIRKIDYELISQFEFWFKSVRNCDHNTTMKYLGNFRKIVNHCLKHGWLQRDPFLGFKMGKKEVHRTALTEYDLIVIAEREFSIERLNIVKDIFLFSCYSGLAYIDVKNLKRNDIIIGVDGEEWIINRRQKTKTAFRIPLLPVAKQILKKYCNYSYPISNDCILPTLSNQKMNAYLKEIADLCGISRK